jgi:hypothetical protein
MGNCPRRQLGTNDTKIIDNDKMSKEKALILMMEPVKDFCQIFNTPMGEKSLVKAADNYFSMYSSSKIYENDISFSDIVSFLLNETTVIYLYEFLGVILSLSSVSRAATPSRPLGELAYQNLLEKRFFKTIDKLLTARSIDFKRIAFPMHDAMKYQFYSINLFNCFQTCDYKKEVYNRKQETCNFLHYALDNAPTTELRHFLLNTVSTVPHLVLDANIIGITPIDMALQIGNAQLIIALLGPSISTFTRHLFKNLMELKELEQNVINIIRKLDKILSVAEIRTVFHLEHCYKTLALDEFVENGFLICNARARNRVIIQNYYENLFNEDYLFVSVTRRELYRPSNINDRNMLVSWMENMTVKFLWLLTIGYDKAGVPKGIHREITKFTKISLIIYRLQMRKKNWV